jgi:hypothetical protein
VDARLTALEVAVTVSALRGLVDPGLALAQASPQAPGSGATKPPKVPAGFAFDPFVRAWTTLTPRGQQKVEPDHDPSIQPSIPSIHSIHSIHPFIPSIHTCEEQV